MPSAAAEGSRAYRGGSLDGQEREVCMFSQGADLQRGWPGPDRGRPRDPARRADAPVVLHRGGKAREHAEYPLAEVELRPPVLHPPSVRDFYAFEQHVKAARAKRGLEVPEEWYRIPVFYFSNPSVIYGPESEIPYPDGRTSWTTSSRWPR